MGGNKKETEGRLDWNNKVGDRCPVSWCGGILVSRISPKADLVVIVCNENPQHSRIATPQEAQEAMKATDYLYW